ncbi:MAG: type II toxin-antitoxin system RelE/ParE family toxin [Candidatus Accumulibacter sp.]|jgi:toxin ParE1/3/4|nr:type II toxin-antitoxin system RelE/ParE family toxin [Accumulibacter sp.]
MLPVVWHPKAQQDLLDIVSFVAKYNPQAAERLGRLIHESAEPLAEHPFLYKASLRKPGYREIVAHPNYLVFYRVLADRVQIEMVAHARQQYPARR